MYILATLHVAFCFTALTEQLDQASGGKPLKGLYFTTPNVAFISFNVKFQPLRLGCGLTHHIYFTRLFSVMRSYFGACVFWRGIQNPWSYSHPAYCWQLSVCMVFYQTIVSKYNKQASRSRILWSLLRTNPYMHTRRYHLISTRNNRFMESWRYAYPSRLTYAQLAWLRSRHGKKFWIGLKEEL
jgi:hypothetical protein